MHAKYLIEIYHAEKPQIYWKTTEQEKSINLPLSRQVVPPWGFSTLLKYVHTLELGQIKK
jgi:hypothetical protein